MDQLIERFEQTRLLVDRSLVATTGCSLTIRRRDPSFDLTLGLDHRVPAHPRRRGHRSLAAPPQHLRRRASNDTTLQLVHVRQDHFEETRKLLRSDLHTATILRAH